MAGIINQNSRICFLGNNTLKQIYIPYTVTEIEEGAFGECAQLSDITIPDGVSYIGNNTFYNCTRLTSVSIPASITSVGYCAFLGCNYLRSVEIKDVNKWCQINFSDYYANPIYYAKSFFIGDDSKPIRHLDIDLDEAGMLPFVFYNAENLETVRVKCHSIGDYAFEGCSNIKQICIDVDELSSSFGGNTNLEAIYCTRDNPPNAIENTFSKYEGVDLYVPIGCIDTYANSETCWWHFLDVYESDFSGLNKIFAPDYESSTRDVFISDNESFNQSAYTYNINGIRIGGSTKHLPHGIYIVRKGRLAKKIVVK